MAFPQNSFLIIVCEGESEVAYIQELNRLFREMEISATLHPVCVGSGFFSNVVAVYRTVRRDNPRTPIHIWVDWDVYARNERQCLDAYSRKGRGIPSFCFSRQNFEDFLATHLAEDELARWLEVCRGNGHLKTPLHSEQYIPIFKEVLFPQYSKGDIPFPLTQQCIERMLHNQNNKDMPLHCDFADTIGEILSNQFLRDEETKRRSLNLPLKSLEPTLMGNKAFHKSRKSSVYHLKNSQVELFLLTNKISDRWVY